MSSEKLVGGGSRLLKDERQVDDSAGSKEDGGLGHGRDVGRDTPALAVGACLTI